MAFSFSSRDNFQLLRYCLCTCNRITRVTVSLCITPLYSITLYQRITVHCISLYTVCMYHSVSLYVSLHSITLYQRITVHCITVSRRWAAQRPMKPGAVLYAAIDRGKQLATRELEPRRATPFELPPTANTSFARPLGRATLCTMATPAAQACATRGVRSPHAQPSPLRSRASVRRAPRPALHRARRRRETNYEQDFAHVPKVRSN